MSKEEDEIQRRLLDHYARTTPPVRGVVRANTLLPLSMKFDPATTRYGLENARNQQIATNGINRQRLIMQAGLPVFMQVITNEDTGEDDDTIDVTPFDGSDFYGEVFTVQKALGLRKKDYDGITYDGYTYAYVDENTRLKTNDSDGSITVQKITPPYLDTTNNILFVVQNIRGYNPDKEEVEWIDENISARRWEDTTVNASARYATVTAATGQRSGLAAVDGTALVDGDIVLDVNNVTASFRGPWIAHSGAWTRPDTALVSGMLWTIVQGTQYADTIWILDTVGIIVIDVTDLNFTQFQNGDNKTARYATVTPATGQRSGLSSVDGTILTSGDIILDMNNNTATYRGLWVAKSGAWTRSTDKLKSGDIVTVVQGTQYANSLWILDTLGTITPGTTSLTFTQFVSGSPTASARVATTNTADPHTTTNGGTLNGVTVATGDKVLDWNNTDATKRGLWIIPASGSWTRATDTLTSGMFITVREGTLYSNTGWVLTTNGTITPGTTSLSFSPQSYGRWQPIVNYTAAPISTTRIGTTSAASFVVGSPVRYYNGAYKYAIVTAVNTGSNYIDVSGLDVSGTISGLWVGSPDCIVQIVPFVPGIFALTASNILSSVARTKLNWYFTQANLCAVNSSVGTVGGNTATINVKFASTSTLTSAIAANGGVGGGSGTAITTSTITNGTAIEIAVVATDATAQDLTVQLVFVLE